jgi:hypothetical protein
MLIYSGFPACVYCLDDEKTIDAYISSESNDEITLYVKPHIGFDNCLLAIVEWIELHHIKVIVCVLGERATIEDIRNSFSYVRFGTITKIYKKQICNENIMVTNLLTPYLLSTSDVDLSKSIIEWYKKNDLYEKLHSDKPFEYIIAKYAERGVYEIQDIIIDNYQTFLNFNIGQDYRAVETYPNIERLIKLRDQTRRPKAMKYLTWMHLDLIKKRIMQNQKITEVLPTDIRQMILDFAYVR